MQEIVAFLEQFIDVEHAARRALLVEPDDDRFQQSRLAYETMAAFPGLAASVYRARGAGIPSADEAQRRLLTQGARRLPYWAEAYEHPERGTLYIAYLSSTLSPTGDGVPEDRTALRMTVGATPEGLRILSWEDACLRCDALGTFEGRQCPECTGIGWLLTGGVLHELNGDPVTVYRFEMDDWNA